MQILCTKRQAYPCQPQRRLYPKSCHDEPASLSQLVDSKRLKSTIRINTSHRDQYIPMVCWAESLWFVKHRYLTISGQTIGICEAVATWAPLGHPGIPWTLAEMITRRARASTCDVWRQQPDLGAPNMCHHSLHLSKYLPNICQICGNKMKRIHSPPQNLRAFAPRSAHDLPGLCLTFSVSNCQRKRGRDSVGKPWLRNEMTEIKLLILPCFQPS